MNSRNLTMPIALPPPGEGDFVEAVVPIGSRRHLTDPTDPTDQTDNAYYEHHRSN